MTVNDIPLFQAIKAKMQWHHARQSVLAENIANSDTPNYRARDLTAPDFEGQLKMASVSSVSATRTHRAHIGSAPISPEKSFNNVRKANFETTPDGNDVVLEEQMLKLTGNQMDYQAASSLYTRGLGLLRTALGRNA